MAESLEKAGILAIIRLPDGGAALDVGHALADGGVRALEVSLTTPGALKAIERLRSVLPQEVAVGAGTVIKMEEAESVAEAGASFGVTPVLRPVTVRALKEHGLAVICGAMTPTEILDAHDSGADLVKVFPARSVGGPGYVREVLAPLPHVALVPTGGVGIEDVEAYVRAGAAMLGVGSSLVDPNTIERKDWKELRRRASRFVDAWRAASAVPPASPCPEDNKV